MQSMSNGGPSFAFVFRGDEQRPGGGNAERARFQGGGAGFVAEVAQMAVDQIRRNEKPTPLDRRARTAAARSCGG
jgi:hypothetical protein